MGAITLNNVLQGIKVKAKLKYIPNVLDNSQETPKLRLI